MFQIPTEQILRRADCLSDVIPEHSYHKSYYHFIKYFQERDVLTEQDLILGANFTYGWMPTILNFKCSKFEEAVAALNDAKKQNRISNSQIWILKELINNSLVGASKLLHFINPDVYAIWDSRVCNFLTGKSHKQKVEKLELFWSYLDLCKRVIDDPDFKEVHQSFINKIGYTVSPMRTIEQIMFINSSTPLITGK